VKFVLEKKEIFLSLSGGSTPEIIYKYLSADYKHKIDWRKVHLFWGDERCVPPDREQSNYGMIKKYLLNFIDIPEKNVHPVDGENDPEKEAVRYSEVIKKIVPLKNGFPVFDLVMLGLGDDGHTASIFPDQMQILISKNICEVAVHPSTEQKRITLSGTVINNARKVIFLITGKSKATIVKQVLEAKSKKFPAEFIHPINGKLEFYLDSDAASLLEGNNLT
jgi:6-phosphogluconolactonase